jgi:hypothetical protein
MSKRYFTLDEANAMIPFMEEAFHRIVQMRFQIRSVYRRLEQLGFAPDDDEFDLDPGEADFEVVSERASLKALINALRDELARIHAGGALVKGLDMGLVDWYARKDGRDIFLCWRLGEKQITHWHEVDAGFAGRRPLSELSEADLAGGEETN